MRGARPLLAPLLLAPLVLAGCTGGTDDGGSAPSTSTDEIVERHEQDGFTSLDGTVLARWEHGVCTSGVSPTCADVEVVTTTGCDELTIAVEFLQEGSVADTVELAFDAVGPDEVLIQTAMTRLSDVSAVEVSEPSCD
ncbi:hypothetical protein C8046_11995 [Serinibacter arcticus]|uniref:Lipoprotein n=1 Tax=Serinibacter arcticus TaxID=1655435 RepID=A0A2U1ZWF4_9MICO|nr:hypothetical protein [Serinibacter arcticus]PWD51270.1 hypothetical protein C8046_11995 [Serinibacter arcticus]